MLLVFRKLLEAFHELDDAKAIGIASGLLCDSMRSLGALPGEPEVLAAEFALLAQRTMR